MVNLAERAVAKSWEGSPQIPEHTLDKLNDGSLHSYWTLEAEHIPGDAGLEWSTPQTLSSLVVRYFDGRMARSASAARTQQWASLQLWSGSGWSNVPAEVIGLETSSVRYVFPTLTTTRIRLLFREPPDPELRRAPDRLGIHICEMEAYSNVPFQWVSSTRVAKSGRKGGYERLYNEAPAGDGHYEVVGPLIIEPKPSRTFRDTLRPTLIVAESRWATTPCKVETSAGSVQLSNGFLELRLSTAGGLRETGLSNLMAAESLRAKQSVGFVLRGADRTLTPADFKVLKIDTSGSNGELARIRFDLGSELLEVSVIYELSREAHYYHKWLSVKNRSDTPWLLLDVTLTSLQFPSTPIDLMAGQELTYPITRSIGGGAFAALESVYWDHEGNTLTYYPGVTIPSLGTYESEKAAVGVYRNQNESVGGWDRGIRDWITEYHAQISPAGKQWPDVYVEGWTANLGLKETRDQPEWTRRWFQTAQKMGVSDIDAYEPYHQTKTYTADVIQRFVDLATGHNIRAGFWFDHGADNDWHGTVVPKRPWACKLSPESEADFRATLSTIEKYKLRSMHWADFFTVWPCDNNSHGHLPGKYSVYAQGQRMLQFAHDVRQRFPDAMLGADGGFSNPQFAKYVDSRMNAWWVDPADRFAAIEPDIHIDRLVAGRNIPYVYGAHVTNLIPWFRILNWVNHMGYENNRHDRAGYRYGMLAALAMAGQLCFNSIPDEIPENEIAFTRKWIAWARENRDYLKEADRLFDRSLRFGDIWQGNADSLLGFAHIRRDRGFVFLLNPSHVEHTAELKLDLEGGPELEVREIYPAAARTGAGLNRGDILREIVPAKQVRVLWIGPRRSDTGSSQITIAETPRSLGTWKVASHDDESATLTSTFEFRASAAGYLQSEAAAQDWIASPWAFDKAYLVLIFKNESDELSNNFVPDNLAVSARINGVERNVYPFKTKRYQLESLTRCYFLELPRHTRSGQNTVALTLPIQTGIAFQGAYLDLPDQMP